MERLFRVTRCVAKGGKACSTVTHMPYQSFNCSSAFVCGLQQTVFTEACFVVLGFSVKRLMVQLLNYSVHVSPEGHSLQSS